MVDYKELYENIQKELKRDPYLDPDVHGPEFRDEFHKLKEENSKLKKELRDMRVIIDIKSRGYGEQNKRNERLKKENIQLGEKLNSFSQYIEILKEKNLLHVEFVNEKSSYIEKLEEEIRILKNTKPTPTVCANGEFRYNFYLENFKMTREELAQKVHKINCEKQGWEYHPLKVGSFGFDNLIMSIGYKLRDNNGPVSIHDGWSANYTYWTESKPYEGKFNYIAPFNPLGDERRTILSKTKYDELDMKEKQKDIIIDEAVNSLVVIK